MNDHRAAPRVIEHAFGCPYCGEEITMLLDPTPGAQQYVEDCEVCCNPIALRVAIEDGELIGFDAEPIEQ